MASPKDLLGLIEQQYPSLSPSARQIAAYVQQHPIALVSKSTAEIARLSGTSKATVSRFFRQLGFESHQDVKDAMLSMREKGLPLPLDENQPDHYQQEIRNLAMTFDGLKPDTVDQVV